MAQAFALPPDARLFDLREQILFIQELACRFFAEENWWAAYKAMSRVAHLSRRLPEDNFLAREAYDAFPGLQSHLARPARPSGDPEVAFEPPPDDPAQAYFRFMRQLCAANARRQREGKPPLEISAVLAAYERQWGRAEADKVRAEAPKRDGYFASG